jgi:aspartyl/glutamyl-tRNA(Asn/Gln) amidotransferase C subunit
METIVSMFFLCYDAPMKKEEIVQLARLSRIRLTDAETEAFVGEIDSVLEYVSVVNTLTGSGELTKKPGVRRNIFREDVVTNEADSYTNKLLQEAPSVKGRHLTVKKILQAD